MTMKWVARSVIGTLVSAGCLLLACGGDKAPKPKDATVPAPSEDDLTSCEEEVCTCGDGSPSRRTCTDGKLSECSCAGIGVCGDGKCDSNETCSTCTLDCCGTCTEARACSATLPQGVLTAAPKLNVKFDPLLKSDILTRLIAASRANDPGMVLLAKAVAAPSINEPAGVTRFREVLARKPQAFAAIQRQLGRPELLSNQLALRGLRMATAPTSSLSAQVSQRDLRVAPAALQLGAQPVVAPMHTLALEDAGADGGDGGASQCILPPKLRMRVSRVTVYEEDDDFANDIVYCGIVTESAIGTRLGRTPKTRNLDEGESEDFIGAEGTFWGKTTPEDPGGDMTIRYDCFEEDTPDGYADFVRTTADVLKENGDAIDDGEGYVTTTASVVKDYLPALLALDSDDHLLTATQVIPRAEQMALTKGATWTIRKKGTHNFSDWDWALKVDAWGCVDNGVK